MLICTTNTTLSYLKEVLKLRISWDLKGFVRKFKRQIVYETTRTLQNMIVRSTLQEI